VLYGNSDVETNCLILLLNSRLAMLDRPRSEVKWKSIGYPLHSPVSPLLPLPYVTVCHHGSNALYTKHLHSRTAPPRNFAHWIISHERWAQGKWRNCFEHSLLTCVTRTTSGPRASIKCSTEEEHVLH